jgi:hypothetical protein
VPARLLSISISCAFGLLLACEQPSVNVALEKLCGETRLNGDRVTTQGTLVVDESIQCNVMACGMKLVAGTRSLDVVVTTGHGPNSMRPIPEHFDPKHLELTLANGSKVAAEPELRKDEDGLFSARFASPVRVTGRAWIEKEACRIDVETLDPPTK